MNLNKTSLTTLKTAQAVPIGASFTVVNSNSLANPIKLSLSGDEFVDVDLVIDAAMEAGTLIYHYYYRQGILLATGMTTMGAKAAGAHSERLTNAVIQKAEHVVVEVRLKQGAAAYNATAIFLTALNRTDTLELSDVTSYVADAVFTLGAEIANARIVTVQLRDVNLSAIAKVTPVTYYLSSDAAGTTPVAADGSLAIGAAGKIIEVLTAKQSGILISNAAGLFNLVITDATGAVDFYLNLLVDGKLITSSIISFAA